MAEEQEQTPSPPLSPVTDSKAQSPPSQSDPPPVPSSPPPPFDPSRSIIKRKALIKNLAAVYHAECLAYCQELLELQKNSEEPFVDLKTPDGSKKEKVRPSKRNKKSR